VEDKEIFKALASHLSTVKGVTTAADYYKALRSALEKDGWVPQKRSLWDVLARRTVYQKCDESNAVVIRREHWKEIRCYQDFGEMIYRAPGLTFFFPFLIRVEMIRLAGRSSTERHQLNIWLERSEDTGPFFLYKG
jgi:hypothetical protein